MNLYYYRKVFILCDVHTFFHVKIMVSNAIPLLFGNYDAHIMYMWDIHLKKVLKNVNYI